jgi:hypothetical protein
MPPVITATFLTVIVLGLYKFCRTFDPEAGRIRETAGPSVLAAEDLRARITPEEIPLGLVISQDEIKFDKLATALCNDPQVINACRDVKRLQA